MEAPRHVRDGIENRQDWFNWKGNALIESQFWFKLARKMSERVDFLFPDIFDKLTLPFRIQKHGLML